MVREGLRVLGVGIRPVVDHLTFRTMHIDKRAKEFLGFGYVYDTKLGAIAYSSWWMKVYRKEGYPSISITQAFNGKRGEASAIPVWVKTFGDNMLHHMAIQVDDIEQAVYYLEKQGIAFVGKIIGDRSSDLRRIFTQPVIKKNRVYTVMELTERHRGYQGIVPPQADQLMKAK
ncbi:MAG: hypothetical protein PHS88_10360 [Candidatus Omnitrophica bacterium]|nr:hypothetical protein [Candidatus Omnitrophota bacterium]